MLCFHLLPVKRQLAAGFLTCYMAAGFPSIYCQVRGSWQQAFSPATWQQAFFPSIARSEAADSRLSFNLLAGEGKLAAGFLTNYMAKGFPSIYCQVIGSWLQVRFQAIGSWLFLLIFEDSK